MALLMIFLLFLLRVSLVFFSKYLNFKLLNYPQIVFAFKIGGLITIIYIYFFLYYLCNLENFNLFILNNKYVFYLESISIVLVFNFLLCYWYIFDKFVVWAQKILLSRQIYFILVAFSSFLIIKAGFPMENYNLIIELENIFKLIAEKELNIFYFATSLENKFILGSQYLWLFLFINFVSFFCNPEILLSEKLLCVLFGPYFPGIWFFTKDFILGVKELDGDKSRSSAK